MGTTASKPAGAEAHVLPAQVASSQEKKESDPATCPLGFGQKQTGGDASPQATTAGSDASPAARCPVKGTKGNAAAVDDASSRGDTHAATAAATTAAAPAGGGTGGGGAASGCPVKKEDRSRTAKYLHPHKYNVYSQRVDDGAEGKQSKPKPPGNDSSMAGLDPSNNMPVNPNQLPAAGQQVPLSTERVRSTIPKGGEETTWTYPSPQMFWNSLSRKGKVEDTKEDDMDVVVSIHNNMNEFTWKKILQWEKLRKGSGQVEEGTEGSEPRLLRFLGRPDDTTPKALVKMMLGHPLPFDRHDWVVDKGGDERRYVIDYYHDEGAEDVDEMPELHSEGVVKSIKVDVRPALDGFRDLTDRLVQMPLARLTGKCDFSPLPLRPSPTMVSRETWAQVRTRPTARDGPNSAAPGQQGQESAPTPTPTPTPSTSTPTTSAASVDVKPPPPQSTPPPPKSSKKSGDREARAVARMKKKCALPLKALAAAEGEGDEEKAQTLALKLEYCTARYLCRKEAKAYKEALTFAGGAGSIAGDGHAYWAERAVEGRLSDMRAALAGFTARQQGRRRREAGQQEGQSPPPPPPLSSSSSSSSSSSPPPPPTRAA